MTKRRAFSLLAFIGYCFVSSNTIAMDLEEKTTPVKILTNSNSIDTNFGSTSQEKITPFEEFSEKWVGNLTDLRNRKEKRDITDADMTKAFLDAYNLYPNAFRTPVKIGTLTHYYPHGATPQKIEGTDQYTPRRARNIAVSPGNKRKRLVRTCLPKLQAHHVEKANVGNVAHIPPSLHQGKSDILHHRPGLESRVKPYRSQFDAEITSVNVHYSERMAAASKKTKKTASPEEEPEPKKIKTTNP